MLWSPLKVYFVVSCLMAWFPQQDVGSLLESVGLMYQALGTVSCQCSLVPRSSQARA